MWIIITIAAAEAALIALVAVLSWRDLKQNRNKNGS
jgi:hypothetical protein